MILGLLQDQGFATAVAHMGQEASIPILRVDQLRETLAGRVDTATEATAEQIGQAVNRLKSVFRLMMLDRETEEFDRSTIPFGGIADLLTRYSERLAFAADIPQTRWMGRSPAGLSATGDSDMRNYVMMVESRREELLADPLEVLDEVLARDAGLATAPEFEWQSLLELGERDRAEVAKIKAEAIQIATGATLMDEDEGRKALDGDPVFGTLEGDAPEPEMDPMDPLYQPPPGADPQGGGPTGGDDG